MKHFHKLVSFALIAGMTGSLIACGQSPEDYDFTVSYDGIATGDVSSSGIAVHDPSILEADGTYYIYGSHMTCAKSTDLLHWERVADGYNKTNPVYGQIFEVADESFAYSGSKNSLITTDDRTTHVWAPDVIYNETMGLYCMYYCTTSTWNASNLCFGTSETPEGPFTWQGALIYSGFNNTETLEATDVLDYVDLEYAKANYIKAGAYNYNDYPNAIDPTVFYDADGRLWMVYGSWSGGIFLLELDPKTGYVIHPEADEENNVDPYYGKRLLGGGHISIEGPYIMYDADTDYYYLFVSYGVLTSNGGYQMRVFRSKTVDGTYVDMNGAYPQKSAMHENFGLKLSGNYKLPSLEKAFSDSNIKQYISGMKLCEWAIEQWAQNEKSEEKIGNKLLKTFLQSEEKETPLQKLRKAFGVSQMKMAELVGVNIKKYRALEKGELEPDAELMANIYEVTKCKPIYFMDERAFYLSYVSEECQYGENREKQLGDLLSIKEKFD